LVLVGGVVFQAAGSCTTELMDTVVSTAAPVVTSLLTAAVRDAVLGTVVGGLAT
jgi:hypothetical protein